MSVLSNNIRTRREALHMTQDELALKLGYRSRSSINKIEKGLADIPQSKLQAFANALETTVPQLLGWDPAQWKNFSKERRYLGIPLSVLAEELDLPEKDLIAWETGNAPGTKEQLEQLQQVLTLIAFHQNSHAPDTLSQLFSQLLQLSPERLDEVKKFIQYQLALQKKDK